MCRGIAVPIHEIPDALIAKHRLADRFVHRDEGAGREIQFLYQHPRRMLPVFIDDQLRMIEWGGKQGPFPKPGWCHHEWIESGLWQHLRPQPATIVAALAVDRGVWYQVKEGIKCVVVRNHVYMLTEPSSHYYRIMTRSDRMPVLIGQRI